MNKHWDLPKVKKKKKNQIRAPASYSIVRKTWAVKKEGEREKRNNVGAAIEEEKSADNPTGQRLRLAGSG
jgi:hypothetical protein